MAEEKSKKSRKGKGSIILEILIVLAFFALVASIYIPKKQWEKEAELEKSCRERLHSLDAGMKIFYMKNNAYTEDLDELINFIKKDTTYKADVDTLIKVPIDSLYRCPQTGDEYELTVSNEIHYKISCPNENKKSRYWLFFTKEIKNHGNIEDGEKSWK